MSEDERPLLATFAAGRKRTGYARYRWQEGGWRVESGVATATHVEIATWAELAALIDEPTLVVGEISLAGQDILHKLGDAILPQPAWHLRRAGFLADMAWARLREEQAGELTDTGASVDAQGNDPATLMPLYVR